MEMMEVDDDTACMAEFFVTQQMDSGKKTYVLEKRTPETNARMKPSTSKTTSSSTLARRTSHSPPPEEPTVQYVNTDLPNPDDEPMLSDMQGIISSDEIHRKKSQAALAKYNKALPEMLADHRAITAQLHHRYSEDEERKRIEQQKNKEAMSIATPISRNGQANDSRKRRNDAPSAEEEWKRNQQWMGQHGFQQQQQQHQHFQQQQYMMMQQQQMAQHGMQMHPHHHMPSTSSADSVHSVPTPASMHQPSPANTNGINPPSMDRAMNEENLAVPEGDWFDELAVVVAKQYSDTVLGPDTYDVLTELDCSAGMKMSPATFSDRLPSAPPSQPTPQQLHIQAQQQQQEANKLRMLQMQQVEEQRQRQMQQQHLQQQQQQQQRHQMLLHQQQMQQQQTQQPQMNGQFANQQAYMQQMRMQQMRYQQQHQQQAQQQQQMMGYGVPNGYPQQMHMHPSAYGHHMPPQHAAFANMN